MSKIYLNENNKPVFDIVKDLYRESKPEIFENLIRQIDFESNAIYTTDGNVFILREDYSVSESDGFTINGQEGASWFKGFRDRNFSEVGKDNRAWINFIERISKQFYDKYSFLQYFHDRNEEYKVDSKKNAKIIKALLDLLKIKLSGGKIEQASGKFNYVIYGVTLKLMLNKNGSFSPVLAKVLFSNGKPMRSALANVVVESLKQTPTSATEGIGVDNSRENREYKLDEINQLLVDLFSKETDVFKYLCLSKEDAKTVERLNGYDNAPIVCENVKLLNLFYVEWPSVFYSITTEGNPVYKAIFGPGNLLSLQCRCGDLLVRDNYISYKTKDGKVKELLLDIERFNEKFGLTDAQVEELLAFNPANDHVIEIVCTENVRFNKPCVNYRCMNQIKTFEKDGRKYCADCPYIEVACTINGELRLTKDLEYSTERKELVAKGESSVCSVCGRKFDGAGTGRTTCPTCRKLEDISVDKTDQDYIRAKKLYSSYSHILPLFVRAFSGGIKVCVEDDGIIVFRLKNKWYVYDKKSNTFSREN